MSRGEWPGVGDLRGRAAAVCVGAMICQIGAGLTYVFGGLQKDIIADLGWTRTMFASARAPVFLVIALVSPVVGSMTVRWGTRPVLLGSTALLAASWLLVSQMTQLWHFYLANVLIGIVVVGFGDVVIGAVVSQWVVVSRGLALGFVYCGTNLAGFVGLPIVAAVSVSHGWRAAVLVWAGAALVLIVPAALWLVREPHPAERPVPSSSDAAVTAAGGGAIDLRDALRTRSFWLLGFVLFCFFFYFIAMIEHTVPYLTDLGFSKTEASAAFGTAVGLGVWSKLGAGVLADRMPNRTAMAVDYALITVSSYLLFFVESAGVLPVFVAVYGLSVAARDVVYPMVIADCFGVTYLARIYGALMLALLPAGALGPVFAAWSHDNLGTYLPAFAVFAVANTAALVAIGALRREVPETS